MKKDLYHVVMVFLGVVLIALCFTSCGEKELSFGEEIFYGIKAAEDMAFTKEIERPVQIAVGENSVWTLTANSRDCVYEQEVGAETMRCLGLVQGEQELVMGISTVDNALYASVSCGENVQVRRLFGDGQWETLLSIPWEDAPEQKRPALFFMDRAGNAYFENECEIWKYSTENGQKTIYELKEPAALLQEKEPGHVEAVTQSNSGIALYALKEEGKAEKKWTIKLSAGQLRAIATDCADTLAMAVNGRILLVDNATGEIMSYFDSIAAGVSSDLLGGLWLTEEKTMYLVEQTAGSGGIWEKLIAQSGPEGDRTVLVYGTVSLSKTMEERVASFNKSNPDYYIKVKEYEGDTITNRRLQMQAAVTSGNGPDILDLYSYCVDNYISYAEQGYLEDLEPYLRREDFSDDILWTVLDLYRIQGKVCMLAPHFTIRGLAVNPAYVTETENWNFHTFVKAIDLAGSDTHIVEGGTAHNIFVELLPGMQGEFIDWDEKRASFNTPEFVSLLELCMECEKESLVRNGVSYDPLEYADKVMMMGLSMVDPGGYLSAHVYYGDQALPYGYPTMDGQVFLVNNAEDACGIYSLSENKEGAWEFVRTLFAEDYQKQMTGYTAAWAVRESCWYEMWDRYATGININGVNAAPATDKEIERLADMIRNGNLTADLMNYTIESLVMEEVDAYFKGDRTAQETAGNIQNRVQLMLEE